MYRVIAIHGASAVGKTSVANELAGRLRSEVRHCGDVVKIESAARGVPPDDLPMEVHRRIDHETRYHAENVGTMLVVEGRFLDEVLASVPNVLIVELTCSEEERKQRHTARGSEASLVPLARRDAATTELRSELYIKKSEKCDGAISLCTDALSVCDVVELILKHWRSLEAGPAAQHWEKRYELHDAPWTTGYPSTELVIVLNDIKLFTGVALEVGCGVGTNATYLASRGLIVTGVDIVRSAIGTASERSRDLGIQCEFQNTDAFDYAIGRDKVFDFIFDRGFFHCLPELLAREWAGRASRMLCEGGRMLVLTGNEHEQSAQGPPKLSSEYLLSMFLPWLSVVCLREFNWDAVAGSNWRALGWSLLLEKTARRG